MFCSKCGEKLAEDAYFCTKCGARIRKGVEAGISVPTEELREAFFKIGQELEKAFSTAAKEIQEAFKTTREEIHESTGRETVVCVHCGERNFHDAAFCHMCGKELN